MDFALDGLCSDWFCRLSWKNAIFLNQNNPIDSSNPFNFYAINVCHSTESIFNRSPCFRCRIVDCNRIQLVSLFNFHQQSTLNSRGKLDSVSRVIQLPLIFNVHQTIIFCVVADIPVLTNSCHSHARRSAIDSNQCDNPTGNSFWQLLTIGNVLKIVHHRCGKNASITIPYKIKDGKCLSTHRAPKHHAIDNNENDNRNIYRITQKQ